MERSPEGPWTKIEKPKSPHIYFLQELQEDFDHFDEQSRPLVEKIINGGNLKSSKQTKFYKAVQGWWQEKYGFSYYNEPARNEVLLRKYSPDSFSETSQLQTKLLEAVQKKDEASINKLKEEYTEKFPDRLESVEALFGFRDFLRKQKEFDIKRDKMTHEERVAQFRDFTEYQFLFTHFLITHGNDKEYLRQFWELTEEIAHQEKMAKNFDILRKGLISQVAAYEIIDELGLNARLSHPDEDAFKAIDLWSEQTAVQTKGWDEDKPLLIETEDISVPAVELPGENGSDFYNTHHFRQLQRKNHQFFTKVKKLSRQQGKEIRAFMMVIPYHKIDFITGRPAPEIVQYFKDKVAKRD